MLHRPGVRPDLPGGPRERFSVPFPSSFVYLKTEGK
jgi:hypothetical protein